MKKIRMIWAASLIAAGLAAAMLVLRMLGLALPDAAVRALGAAELIALPVLAYSTVRLVEKKEQRR